MSDPEARRTINNGQRPSNTLPNNQSTNNQTLENVTFLDDEDPEVPTSTARSERQSKSALERMPWISYSSRAHTDLNDAVVESRVFQHKHLIRRPRALQYIPVDAEDVESRNSLVTTPSQQASISTEDQVEQQSTEDVAKQLRRLSLFVDLIWVGIIANLSETFGEQAFRENSVNVGHSVLEFILLFLPIWRLWENFRSYTSNYYVDDVLQRSFVVWILVLAVFIGINAPFVYNPDGETNSFTLCVAAYLITKASFIGSQLFQSIFLPQLRLKCLFQLVAMSLTSSLWIGAIFAPYPAKAGLVIVANLLENPIAVFIASPAGDGLLLKGYKTTSDVDLHIERYEGFFIILLGEGVFRLIEGSPSGLGLNAQTGTVITALMLFYVLHWLYFNGDQSRKFVHALRQTWWKPVLWQFLHIVLFGSLLFLDSSTLFLVQHSYGGSESGESSESHEEIAHHTHYAVWTASISLAIAIFCMTSIALLNRVIQESKTLLVHSRYIRLAPRLVFIAIVLCLPLAKHLVGGLWFGAAVVMLYMVFLWEWIAGLERGFQLFEKDEES